ncbi:MAG: glycine cleavage system protein GcvH [Fimbriimonadaceae bacterium]|nr:glycine cleavage system protein GcvH [Fimbriimonadaceae bacterium]
MNVPEDLQYTRTHEWVRIEGDTATIGITDHAQSELGDIVYVELPTPGRALAQDEGFTTVESVKTVSDVYAPAACEVVEANPALGAQAELLNTDPYGEGWLVKVRFTGDPPALLSADEYKSSLG